MVCRGTRQDAQWSCYGANVKHGIRRTNADKERAVKLALAHPKAATKSNHELASHVGVAEATIRRWRQKLGLESSHAGGGAFKTQNRTQVLTPQGLGNSAEATEDAVPMGDEPEDIAREFVDRYRKRGYPDDQIAVIAKTRSKEERKAILAVIAEDPDAVPMGNEPGAGGSAVEKPAPTDAAGVEIPKALRPDFVRAAEIQHLMTQISRIKSLTLKAYHDNDPLYAALNPSSFEAECENVYRELRALKPHAVCPYCAGRGCKACLKRGWVGQFVYDAAPKEMTKKVSRS